MLHNLRFGLLASSLVILVACGSTSANDVLAESADAGGNADGATVGSDGGTASGDGATLPTPSDGGVTRDASPGGTTSTLTCGAASCAIPGQVCCSSRVGQGAFSFACENGTTCAAADAGAGQAPPPTTLACTSAANCGQGEVCCLTVTNATSTATCKAPSACNGGGQGGTDTVILCDPANPAAGCPANQPCSSKNIGDWRLPSGFGTCGGKGN